MAKAFVTEMRKVLDLAARKCSKPFGVQFGHFGAFNNVTCANYRLKTRSVYFRTGVTHVMAKFLMAPLPMPRKTAKESLHRALTYGHVLCVSVRECQSGSASLAIILEDVTGC